MSDSNRLNRRDFVKTAGTAAAASLVLGGGGALASPQTKRRRYALIGTGVRGSSMWGSDLVKKYSDVLEFVGLADTNPKRMAAAKELMGVDCPTFNSFEELAERARPELLMVTTVDAAHAEYITKALDRGIDVITEKPMVIDEKQVKAVLDASRRSKAKLVVAHNYRYAPKHQKIKEIIQSGEIGPVTSVDFSWYLDTSHGADYFRRWHRLKSKGGSLWVHKASHHFDLVNWWLGADPVEVNAFGELRVYGKANPYRHTHCRPCPHKAKCPFYWDITKNPRLVKLYVEAEGVDGYHRDGCVFREDIDIWDTMNAIVKYSNGAQMSYSLDASLPIEGYSLAFNGERGRLEVRDYERQPWKVAEETEMYLIKNFSGKREKVEVPQGEGGHGGGDDRLRDLMFRNVQAPDHMRLPDARAGALSVLTGVAARTSIEKRRPVKISELVSL